MVSTALFPFKEASRAIERTVGENQGARKEEQAEEKLLAESKGQY